MASRKTYTGLILALILLVCIYAAYRLVSDPTITGLNPKLYRQYESIEEGMNKQQVVRMMGEPSGQAAEFRLSQYKGFEKEYARAEQSNSKYYLFWHSGIDITYTVGFDANDRVTLKACGGT